MPGNMPSAEPFGKLVWKLAGTLAGPGSYPLDQQIFVASWKFGSWAWRH
jgi:hypothetical protein